ncbi:MAG: hypothetical protein LBC64_10205 [Fibromonadaceae bacterium]|jgi:hypothetical protein|nr:hypothetical protein [Fibromonadaceae bacterium]
MAQRKRSSVGKVQVLSTILAVLAFAGMVFWGCSQKDDLPEFGDSSSSQEGGSTLSSTTQPPTSSPGGSTSSDSQNPPEPGASSSSVAGSVSSSSFSSSSHAPEVTDPGANCAYKTTWCGGITFDNVKKTSFDADDIGATDKGQDRPNCVYATAITQIGNESGGISINGTTFATGSASRCGGDSGHGYGSTTACATKFASVAKVDGGYYIYIPSWAGQKFKTTGGQPVCTGTPVPPAPGASSSSIASSNTSSSSAASASTSGCVDPMYGVPPNGTKSCIKKDGKCYTCNPDRGNECSQPWIWQANSIDTYWYKEVSCSEGGGSATYNLTCTGLAQTGVAGTAVTQPTVKCNADNATATFASAPIWNNPAAGTYNVTATANCGGNKTVSCGTLTVSAAPSTNDLTCTGMPTTGTAGTAITQPTVKCGTSTLTSGLTWTGAPTWTNPTANNYTVTVAATCGGSSKTASCGTLKVNPKLSCGNPSPATVIAGTSVTPPTVTCGSTTLQNTSQNIVWSGAPDYWSGPAAGNYNNIKATANTGDCSGQTATCGSLTVNNKLGCESVTQAITTGQTPTKPKVTCGSTTITSGITWSPTSINSAINTAQTISNVTAAASCGGSNQTATCAGTITVTAQQQPTPSSSSGGGGGSPSYTPTAAGNEESKVTQYWDACKPSCSWSGKGGIQANSCNISGANIGHNDSDRSACDGGSAFTCMKQAPWKVGDVSFGYVAAGIGACGDCYQFNFPNGHVMVVMKTNIGDIKEGAKFDLMIPGGGVGDFDALTRQVTNSGVSNPDMGVRYGGFRGKCGWDYSAQSVNCVKDMCNNVFKNLPDLKAGCLWWTENLGNSGNWNNPTVKYKKVTCPKELTDKY